MGCATGLVKFVMFFFNFIFVVGGILMVTAGSLTLAGFHDYQRLVQNLDSYKAPPIILIAVGAVVFFIAFMGCCAVLRESNCMMMTYAVFLTIILLIQVGIAVAAAVYKDEFKEIIHKGLESSLQKYDREEVKQSWDSMQSNLKCCGNEKYTDWKVVSGAGGEAPESCCKDPRPNCSAGAVNKSEEEAMQFIYTQGCVDKLFEDLKIKYVVLAAAVIAGIELIGVLFSCCLAARFRRKNYA